MLRFRSKHEKIIVEAKGGFVDEGSRGLPLNDVKSVQTLQKPVSMKFRLHILSGNRMVLRASGVQRRFFRQKSNSNMQFACIAQKSMLYSG